MIIRNAVEIIDDGIHVVVKLDTGSVVSLPIGDHVITILEMDDPSDNYVFDLKVFDLKVVFYV